MSTVVHLMLWAIALTFLVRVWSGSLVLRRVLEEAESPVPPIPQPERMLTIVRAPDADDHEDCDKIETRTYSGAVVVQCVNHRIDRKDT